jgi:serpin B
MFRRIFHLLFAVLILLVVSLGGVSAQESDVLELVSGNTDFAFNLYAFLRQAEDGNLFFSPYSMSQALAMTYAGADGETAQQMANTLSFTLPQPALHETFNILNADLVTRGNAEADETMGEPGRTLRIANALWGEQTFPFNPAYVEQIQQYYGGGLRSADFINAPEEARGQINGWVADETEDRIQNIVPEGAIHPDTRLVLANAIYFKNVWLLQFSPNTTQDGDFFLLDGTTLTVPFMSQVERFNYLRGDNFQAVEFPYWGGMSMLVILPDEGQFEAFEETFDGETLNHVIGQLSFTRLDVHLPKFEFDYATSLSDTLASMGMPDAFNGDAADFSGMVEGDADGDLFISDVLHKAFIAVDEYGTEAAAATVVILQATSAEIEPDESILVRIDRPFIFAIRDQTTGSLLFLGRVLSPSA